MFVWTHEQPGVLVQAAVRFLAEPWPWHAIEGLRIQARTDVSGSRYWPPLHMIVVPAHANAYELAHEIGHAFDQTLLNDDHRLAVRDLMGVPRDTPWLIRKQLTHEQVTGESFAEWFAYELGERRRTRWGDHDWSHPDIRVRLRQLVLNAAERTPAMPEPEFIDVDGTTHEQGIRWAVREGIVSGYPDGTFRPQEPVTRGQLATILHQMAGGDDA